MPIRAYLGDHAAFGPDAVKAMSEALEQACAALQVDGDQDREIIATRIIELARRGIVDAKSLSDRVVEAMRSL